MTDKADHAAAAYHARQIIADHKSSGGILPNADNLARAYLELREIEQASRALANHCKRSLDAGPISKNVRGEAMLWHNLRAALGAPHE